MRKSIKKKQSLRLGRIPKTLMSSSIAPTRGVDCVNCEDARRPPIGINTKRRKPFGKK